MGASDNSPPLHMIVGGTVGAVTLFRVVAHRRKTRMVVMSDGTVQVTRDEAQAQKLKERQAIAAEELKHCSNYNPSAKKRVKEYFTMFSDPNWKLKKIEGDMEVWRLPGEKIHRIMGVKNVNATPNTCMEYFEDPKAVFTKLFPKIDLMFTEGKVLEIGKHGNSTCQGVFKMPMPVGNMPAKGIKSREMVWEQNVAKLKTGNVLVTAESLKDASHIPEKKGCIRGDLLASGYYGRENPGTKSCKVWYIVQADPKGILPSWLVNLASGRQADNVQRLSHLFANGKP